MGLSDDPCPRCVAEQGLCDRHHRGILPELARNIGWLKLMGEAQVEQTRLQERDADAAAVAKAKRREARKAKRGYAGLLAAIKAA